ncbi:MAG: ComEC/Rec2 family competence protein [Ruminococcaceae bacterium]|nr:ComEC/Rec2 family competence protein [Oscillospiraceae bacterium]
MCVFKNRPLALSFLCFVAVSFLCYSLHWLLCLAVSGVFLLLFSVAIFHYVRERRRFLFLAALCLFMAFLSAFSSCFLFRLPQARLADTVGREVVLEGVVIRTVSRSGASSVFDVSAESIDGVACNDTVRLRCEYVSTLDVGERFRAEVTGTAFAQNGGYDERRAAFSDGVFCMFVCTEDDVCVSLGEANFLLSVWAFRVRKELSFRLSHLLGSEEGALSSALLLGERSGLSEDTVLAFRRCGISHLLALSGLHVSILIGFLELVLGKLRAPRWVRAMAIILLSLLYLLVTGCSPSAIRAVMMVCVLSMGLIFKGEYDSFTALMTALFLILLLSPHAISDLGMWMSFLAAGSIILFLPPLNEALRAFLYKRKLSQKLSKRISAWVLPLLVGIVANLGLMLVQALFFGEVSLLSIPATLLLSLPLTWTLVLSILCGFGLPVAFPCRLCASFMLWASENLSRLQGVLLPIGDLPSILLICALTLILIVCAVAPLRHTAGWILAATVLGALVLPCSILYTQISFSDLKASYLAGDGAEAIVVSVGGECSVIDASDGSAYSAYSVAEKARTERCTEIGELILTDYRNAHAAYIGTLAGELRIRRLILPAPQDEDEKAVAKRLTEEAELHGIKVTCDASELGIEYISRVTIARDGEAGTGNAPLLISLRTREGQVAYANIAFFESDLLFRYRESLTESDVLIVGGEDDGKTKLRLPIRCADTKLLILSDEKLKALLPLYVRDVPVAFGCAEYSFE